jgi:HlyD family secretion protein
MLKKRKLRTWLIISIAALVLIVLGLGVLFRKPNEYSRFTFAAVERGDIENIISSTGTLEAKGTVEVGTQVSGSIDKVFVDFNDKVTKNQILAVLDTTLLSVAVRDAKASLLRAQAELELARTKYEDALQLHDAGYISELDFNTANTEYESARASLLSAQASLERAEVNLKHAVIRSPISGTVINRVVESGQTVAASLSTPTLFLIAEDLALMEIHAYVDESDIGQIKEGQNVRFTVEAYPDDEFTGTVREIRLQPEVIQNVVNYTVVIDAQNKDGLLLPGMTATVDFLVEQRKDALMISNAALHFQPTSEMLAEFRKTMQEKSAAPVDSTKQHVQYPGSVAYTEAQREQSEETGVLWFLNTENKLSMTRIRTGITDGKNTEIVDGPGITEGMQFISRSTTSGTSNATSTNNTRQPPGPPRLF